MILIADAGSTKTDWVLLKKGSEDFMQFTTPGINPAQHSEQDISKILNELKSRILEPEEVRRIFYYGAGCLSSETNKKIENQLRLIFKNVSININSDLLAACRALFNNGSGIVGILGTGSNSCLYVNGKIEEQIPSLGYILGDEGSGAALGKRLVSAVYKNGLSQGIINDFIARYELKLPDVIEKVYRSGKGSAYLASFAPYILEKIKSTEIKNLAVKEFENYFDKNIIKYHNISHQMGIVGSIGFEFQTILKDVAERYGIKLTKFLRSPISGLISYHKND